MEPQQKMTTPDSDKKSEPAEDREQAPGPLAVMSSVLAAAFGVQSSKNRERDFKQGKARHFIIGGIIFTLLFMLGVYTVVQTVLSNAQ